MALTDGPRSPGFKFGLAILVGLVLAVPLFSVWLLVYDRQTQSEEASASITAGWGGPQTMAGPVIVIPYRSSETETLLQNGQAVTRTSDAIRELRLAPEVIEMTTDVLPELRKRSIYEAVVYQARVSGKARFAFPQELSRKGIDLSKMDLGRAELRFGLSDPRGFGSNAKVAISGHALRLQPGGGSNGGRGFFAWLDASSLQSAPIAVDFAYDFRGNASVTLAPEAGETRWAVHSTWPSPSFAGEFLPDNRQVSGKGFDAFYRIGNLALGHSLTSMNDRGSPQGVDQPDTSHKAAPNDIANAVQTAAISLIQPVDLYSQVNRATKYGFLFIGFTFLALLMFDVLGGVRVSAVEYLLMGAAIVLFFVLLLAFAEVIGFTAAYIAASAAIAGLNTAYSAAVLESWRRAWFIGALLVGLYAVLYILLSLEAFSLLIGSLMLFAALAGVMYATRRIDWSGSRSETAV